MNAFKVKVPVHVALRAKNVLETLGQVAPKGAKNAFAKFVLMQTSSAIEDVAQALDDAIGVEEAAIAEAFHGVKVNGQSRVVGDLAFCQKQFESLKRTMKAEAFLVLTDPAGGSLEEAAIAEAAA